MVKAIFLDIDGTLRDERRGVPESAVKAIRRCRHLGMHILICTGRNMASIQPDILAIQTDGVIAGGGCYILDGNVVRKNAFFQYEEMKETLACLTHKNMPFALESQKKIYMNEAASLWFRKDFEEKLAGLDLREKEQQRKENAIFYEDTMDEYRPGQDRIHKICIWSAPGQWPEITSIAEKGTIAQQGMRGGWWYLEALPRGCSKGAAIREWCGLKHIRLRDTMSFGDGKNDIDMLQTTGIGVAMENGDDELKACASSICGTAWEDGIWKELIKRGIIQEQVKEDVI